MSGVLHFSEHALQEAALVFMTAVYILRVRWILKWNAAKERQAPTGTGETNPRKSILYSWASIANPLAMESTRTLPLMYIQFVVFHLGVAAAIFLSFVIPYGPGLLESPVMVLIFQITIGAAFIAGVMRFVRRVTNIYVRSISSPDDYFSIILLTVWFAFAFLAVPNNTDKGEWHLLTYFMLTAFFLVYVPFSKISHYLYYPFTRFYLGKSFGRRGVFPLKKHAHKGK